MHNQKIIYTKKLAEYLEKPSKVFKKSGNIEREFYEKESLKLQYELVKLQKWVIDNNKRLLVLFEGMDTAGKSSTTMSPLLVEMTALRIFCNSLRGGSSKGGAISAAAQVLAGG